jgi:hypothetical protein
LRCVRATGDRQETHAKTRKSDWYQEPASSSSIEHGSGANMVLVSGLNIQQSKIRCPGHAAPGRGRGHKAVADADGQFFEGKHCEKSGDDSGSHDFAKPRLSSPTPGRVGLKQTHRSRGYSR